MDPKSQLTKANQQALTNYSKNFVPISALSKEENKTLEVKYASRRFDQMTLPEAALSAKVVLLKIHVITGWVLPEAEMRNILIDQMAKKLTEAYGNVNADEVEFAFRNNTTVKDWGKAMNLAMIDEVMLPYLFRRSELSKVEEASKPVPQIEYADIEMSDEDLLTATHEVWKLIQKPDVIPESVYFYLEGEGKIALTDVQKKDIAARVSHAGLSKELHKTMCRKTVVAEYFKSLNAPTVLLKTDEGAHWEEITKP